MASILFVFGSTGGNTEMTVEYAAGLLSEKGHSTTVVRAENAAPEEMLKYDVVVLASPTYGHGSLQEHMLAFAGKMKKIDLKGKSCAVIGLGDPKYEAQYHIESAPLLEKAITKSGGKLLLPALKISRTPVVFLKAWIPNWVEQFSKALK